MVSISFLLGHKATGQIRVPAGRVRDVQRAWKRRTSDIVMDAFQHALVTKNLDYAADLLALLETWQERHAAHGAAPRQEMTRALRQARQDLARLSEPQRPAFPVVVMPDEPGTDPESAG